MVVDCSFAPIHMACTLTLPWLTTRLIDDNYARVTSASSFSPSECLLFGLPTLVSNPNFDHTKLSTINARATPGHDFDPTTILLTLVQRGFKLDPEATVDFEVEMRRFCHRVMPDIDDLEDRLGRISQEFEGTCDESIETTIVKDILATIKRTLRENAHLTSDTQLGRLSDFELYNKIRTSIIQDDLTAMRRLAVDVRLKRLQDDRLTFSPLLHLVIRQEAYTIFQHLLDIGYDDSVTDATGNTVLHLVAKWGHSVFCRTLVNGSPDSRARQTDVNYDGYTSVLLAMNYLNYDIVRAILPLCCNPQCFTTHVSLYALALMNGALPPRLVEAFLDANVPIDDRMSPFLQVRPNSDVDFLQQLAVLRSGYRETPLKGYLAFQSLLLRLPMYKGYSLERELIIELLPIPNHIRVEVVIFRCLQVMPTATASPNTSLYYMLPS
ncbi:hypothetical protein BJX65DRAFT_20216 [Aspergillus insuetus]